MLEPLLLVAGVFVAVFVGKAWLASTAQRDAVIDAAWAEARRVLHADRFALRSHSDAGDRTLRFACGEAFVTLFEKVEAPNGRPQAVYAVCEVYGLPASDGVKLKVRKALLPTLDATAGFERRFAVKATPAAVEAAFLDLRTRERVVEETEPFELEHGLLRIRKAGWAESHDPLLTLARYGEALCRRWLDMVEAPRLLATDLGFDASTEPLRFDGTTVLGKTFRRGRSWQIELACSGACEIVLRTLEPPSLELRFDALTSTRESIELALETKESELGTASAYR